MLDDTTPDNTPKIRPAYPLEGDTSIVERTIRVLQDLLKYRLDIEAALKYGNDSHTFDDIAQGVIEGRYHFYPLEDAFVLMQLNTYPQHKVYHVFLAGGNSASIEATHPWMLENAKALGAKYVTISGRVGWLRRLKKYGWKHQYTVLSLEVK